MSMTDMIDLDLSGKRVLIRQDFNVPILNGKIVSWKRIDSSLDSIKFASDSGASVMLMSHFGRPEEGVFDATLSLKPIAHYLSHSLGKNVPFIENYLVTPPPKKNGEVVLLENVRFNCGEKSNDENLSRKYAELCDIFVMDAFGIAHREQASTHGVAKFSDLACCGPLMRAELDALSQVFSQPKRPIVAVVGGAKVSTKLTVLQSLSKIVDQFLPGGSIANTLIAASGYKVGNSLIAKDLLPEARKLLEEIGSRQKEMSIPSDVVVAKSLSESAKSTVKSLEDLDDSDMILDIGPQTTRDYASSIEAAGTIVWNGPLGVFEFNQFSNGTKEIGKSIARSSAFSVAGGGDTLAALEKLRLDQDISYISTGGGAFLEFLEGKILPAIDILKSEVRRFN